MIAINSGSSTRVSLVLTSWLDRFRPMLAGADADAVFHRQNKNLAVANLARFARAASLDHGVDGRFDEIVVHGDLQLDLPEQIDADFAAPVDFGLPLLPAKTLHVHDGQPNHLHFGQGRFDVLELAWLDDSNDEFHGGYRVKGFRKMILHRSHAPILKVFDP